MKELIHNWISDFTNYSFRSRLNHLFIPILTVFYFLVFNFANNSDVIPLSQLTILFLPAILFALLIYLFISVLIEVNPLKASIASFFVLVYIFVYGFVFVLLRKFDFVQLEHLNFLPLYFLIILYSLILIKKFNFSTITNLHTGILTILIGLIIFNIIRITPVEIKKVNVYKSSEISNTANIEEHPTDKKNPDIYFIILDEAAGFDVIRSYFHYEKIDKFVTFLENSGFYVAEQSFVDYPSTLHAMATRLNFTTFPPIPNNIYFYNLISNNKAMEYLTQKGYTTIVFSELNAQYAYPAMDPIQSDFVFHPEENFKNRNIANSALEFYKLILDNSIFSPFLKNINIENPILIEHDKMLNFTFEKITQLDEINSPKFVYVHLLFPHLPFMYDEHGNFNTVKNSYDYNYYLGHYKYAMSYAQKMIESLLAEYNETTPSPVIILQSDHGARNQVNDSPTELLLKDYPPIYKSHIVNALRIPGCEGDMFLQNMKPINTFPILFNCIFTDDIPLQ